MFHDVTERKQAEERLNKLVERLDLATRAARMGIWDWDVQKNELVWDDQMYRLYGVSREDFSGAYEDWLERIHPDDRALSDDLSERARLGDADYDTQFRIMLPDEKIRFIKAFGQVIRDDNGHPLRMIGVNYDVTARKQAEDDLRVALTKYRTLFSTIPIGVTVSDEAGNILESNSVAEKILGLSQEGQEERSIGGGEWQVVRADGTIMPSEEFASVRALKEKQLVENVEMGIVKSKKETTWISVTADLLPLEDYGVVVAYNDISERKRAEEKLKSLLNEKEILLAEVHHRVKNNLQVVSSLLNLQAEGIDDKRILAVLEESRNRIQSMSLVHEQLYRSHEYAHIDLRMYIDQLASTLFNMYEIEPERIELKLDDENVILDLERAIPCGLLLNELITNSLKYAFPQVMKGHIKITIKPSGGNLLLEFSDNGVGLPKHIDFHNTHSLGLQLIYLLTTHDLHGSITLDRTKGTLYRIDIPLSHPE
jgi:PAS domain S-box-containing protein